MAKKKKSKTAIDTDDYSRKKVKEFDIDTDDYSRKKVKEFDIDTNIKVAYKTGSIIYGKKRVLRSLRQNPFKMLIIANNCSQDLENQLNYFNSLLKNQLFIYRYKGSSWDLGLVCAKPYMISVIGIEDQGDSDLLSLKATSK